VSIEPRDFDNVTDIFQEVEEDVRREKLHKLWRRYGIYFIGLAALVVVGVGGGEAYRYFSSKQSEDRARAYLAATDALASDPKSAEAALSALAAKGGGYGLLAQFRLAQLKTQAGDTAGALDIYDHLSAQTKIEDPLHGLAILKAGYLMLDGASVAGVEERLGPVASGTGPWRHAALEVLAFASLKAGDSTKARERFHALAGDATAPPEMASRARDMESTLGPVESQKAPASGEAPPAGPPPPAPEQP